MKRYLLSAGILAGFLGFVPLASAVTTSINSGSLGSAADGVNSNTVVLGVSGPLAASGDTAASYTGGANTVVPFQPALNPSTTSPFTVEFWSNPSASDNDDAAVSNRTHSGNRTGWVFFQRDAVTGWNFRMYNGASGNTAWDITGGTAVIGAWTHVVAVYDGTSPKLYVNGVSVGSATGPGGYNVSIPSTNFSIGAHDTGASPYAGALDETAIYGTALTPAQILAHYNAASSVTPGAYSSLVTGDGALLYLANVPEPTSAGLALLGVAGMMARRRRL